MTFEFSALIYRADARPDSWTVINLPEDIADEIEEVAPKPRRAFDAVKVEVTIGSSTWVTSVFPVERLGTSALPVKRPILKAERLAPGDTAQVRLRLI